MILQILVNGVKLCYCKSVHRGTSLFQLSQNISAAFCALVAVYMYQGPIRQPGYHSVRFDLTLLALCHYSQIPRDPTHNFSPIMKFSSFSTHTHFHPLLLQYFSTLVLMQDWKQLDMEMLMRFQQNIAVLYKWHLKRIWT